ncbi:MAG TPA: sugar transferase [Solirubrobacterales bacterium]|nr:sugar transferase [Solirubrobacterales bacterium]
MFTKAPRVTRVGRFIRRLSLDEVPQLLDVILGNRRSLVRTSTTRPTTSSWFLVAT